MKLTEYSIEKDSLEKRIKIAVISDLHGSDVSAVVSLLKDAAPDLILAPGDILERVDGKTEKIRSMNELGLELLSSAAKVAPTFYSLGNHELGGSGSWGMGLRTKRPERARWRDEDLLVLRKSGVRLLDDSYLLFDGLAIGGLTSGILNEGGKPRLFWLDEFCRSDCPKILLCHHPEYYEKYLRLKNIDLIVSGHAHGGQWIFFGKGVFAPGQGVFPKYTRGIYENRLLVGTGLKKSGLIPRLFNPAEVVTLSINK